MFYKGDKVTLTQDCRDVRFPQTFKKGETGVLGRRYRVQDGIEVWELILDSKHSGFLGGQLRIAVFHIHIEKLGGVPHL